MFQNVFHNDLLDREKLNHKYNCELSIIGDKEEMNFRFGSSNKTNILKFIKLKRLKPLIDTFNYNEGKCCLSI